MAKEKLFKTADEIIEGYGLKSVKDSNGKRKVYLKGRVLKSGNVALVRYSCDNYNVQRVSTGKVLVPETTMNDKTHNKEILRLQMIECDTLNSELERKEANFVPMAKSKIRIIDYIEDLSQKALQETGKRNSYYGTYHSLAIHIEMCFGKNTMLKDLNKEWVLRFLDFLKHDAVNLNYIKSTNPDKRKELPLSDNSQLRIYRNLNTALAKAKRNGLIAENPCDYIERRDKPKEKKGTRVYMELEEVKRLIATPFPKTASTADFRNAFLFACCTGLRFSDLRQLSMNHIKKGESGKFIDMTQFKTKEELKIYLDDFALSLIPDRQRTKEEPIFKLPKNANANDNKAFKKWFEDAKIEKHITWHCARHTTATLMLSNEVPLAVVSKQLGHGKIATTEIYAKIVDKAQANAAKKLSDLITS